MKKTFCSILLIVTLSLAAFASSSASYIVSVEALGGGGGDASSAHYSVHGKTRATAYGIRTSTDYRLGEGFMNASFQALNLIPLIASISPSSANNTAPVSVVIKGSNFSASAEASLTLIGQADITGESVIVQNSGEIDCTFNITNKATGAWSVFVQNSDGTSSVLSSAFAIVSPSGRLKVMGKPINYPNPFNPDMQPTTIKYVLSKDANITLNIFNMNGERIWQQTFFGGSSGGKIGVNEVLWDGYTVFSQKVGNGIYVYQIASGGDTLATGKIAVFR